MKFLVHVHGPSDAGSGERHQMLERATQVFAQADWPENSVVRVDVPGRGQSVGVGEVIRPEVEPAVPALQSGSLFLERTGVQIVDAQNLQIAEAQALAELISHVEPETGRVVLVSAGELPVALKKVVKEKGEVIKVTRIRPKDTQDWLASAARERRLNLSAPVKQALQQRFGSDIGAMEQALEQLMMVEETITPEMIRDRFQNRPDLPTWDFTDAVSQGDVSTALDRLHNFMIHSHPLVLIAVLENDLRRRALAACAPNLETFASWIKTNPKHFPTQKAWRGRNALRPEDLRWALDALRRADQTLKTMPEEVHMVTMERLTVALSRRYSR